MSDTTDTEAPSVPELHTAALDAVHAAIEAVQTFLDNPDVVDNTTLHVGAKHAAHQLDHALVALQGLAPTLAAGEPEPEPVEAEPEAAAAAAEPTAEPEPVWDDLTPEEKQAAYQRRRQNLGQGAQLGQQMPNLGHQQGLTSASNTFQQQGQATE